MALHRDFYLCLLSAALWPGISSAQTAEKPALTARVIHYSVQCPSPRDVPCPIKKPVLAGYHLLTKGVRLDDQGRHWIADLSKARQINGRNEALRVLADNGILHVIEVGYPAEGLPQKEGSAPPAKNKPAGPAVQKAKKKTDNKVAACYERCRNTP